jgi:hypothetical protein
MVLAELADPWWKRGVDEHRRNLAAGTLAPPPYAEPRDLLGPVD